MAILAIVIGVVSGVISSLIGLGRGTFIVSALIYVFKMSQRGAQRTSCWPEMIMRHSALIEANESTVMMSTRR